MELLDFYIRSIALNTEKIAQGEYPYNIPAITSLGESGIEFTKQVTIFVGENGSGKSTLIEALAIASGFNPEGGSRNFNFSSEDSHSDLHSTLVVAKGVKRPKDGYFLRAESYYNVATNLDELDEGTGLLTQHYGGKSLHHQSHGESFMSLVRKRLGGHGLYIFDEPESALSPARQMELLAHMKRLVDANSQILLATHSPLLMAYPGADIIELSDNGFSRTALEETDHYQLYASFIDNPDRFVRRITEK